MTNGDVASHDEYIPVEEVADLFRLCMGQGTRCVEKVRTLKKGRRLLSP